MGPDTVGTGKQYEVRDVHVCVHVYGGVSEASGWKKDHLSL